MDVRLKFLGGAQSVTGSKYLLELNKHHCLIDCGLFQGLKELRLRNWDKLPIEIEKIDSIVLTHGHLDHSGYVPRLIKDGCTAPVYCTTETAALLEILWMDAAKLQEEEAEFAKKKGYSKHSNPKPLFDQKDAKIALERIKPIPFSQKLELSHELSIIFHPAGHILGAASVEMTINGSTQQKTLLFSGDLGRQNDPILYPPTTFNNADIVLIESTYGNRQNKAENTLDELGSIINRSINDGVVLIPAFTIGRTQNLLFMLHALMESGKIPKTPVYIDSPMAISVTKIYQEMDQSHKLKDLDLFNYSQFHYVQKHEQSAALQAIKTKAIIISASGMITGGRILTHLFHRLKNKQDLLLFVGYQADGTRGRRIMDREEKIKIFGELLTVNCQVDKIDGLSAHADQDELMEWFSHLRSSPKYTFIIHGEIDAAKHLKGLLEEKGNQNVIVPNYLESFQLFDNI